MKKLRTVVIMDYQNVYLTAHDIFDPDGEKHASLVHPMRFAKVLLRRRNEKQREGYPEAELAEVMVFRGLPHVDHDPELNRYCRDQATQWERDGARVELRGLKYTARRGADGRPIKNVHGKKEVELPGREKGVDVLCAIWALRWALKKNIDLVILASRDSDLAPVLDSLYDMRGENPSVARIETASWFDPEAKRNGRFAGGSLRPGGSRSIWNTNLDRQCYEESLDPTDYTRLS